MTDLEARYGRQRRLPEVGERGQELLGAAVCRVASTPAGDVAREYLARAGVGGVVQAKAPTENAFPHAGVYRFAAPRQFGAGAYAALSEVLRVLGRR